MKSRPDFCTSDGLVVTPSSRPVSARSRISAISAVSAKNFMAMSGPRWNDWPGHSRRAVGSHPIREAMMSEHVRVDKQGGVLALTLARPERRNAITVAMYAALADAVEKAQQDPDLRLITITGEGEDFTAGNDLADFLQALPREGEEIAVWRLL